MDFNHRNIEIFLRIFYFKVVKDQVTDCRYFKNKFQSLDNVSNPHNIGQHFHRCAIYDNIVLLYGTTVNLMQLNSPINYAPCLSKTFFSEPKILFPFFSRHTVPLDIDHLWRCPKSSLRPFLDSLKLDLVAKFYCTYLQPVSLLTLNSPAMMLEVRIPIVIHSWLIVTNLPRIWAGAASATYTGTDIEAKPRNRCR